MMNLFAVFDPLTGWYSLHWISIFYVFIPLPLMYWFIPSRIQMFYIVLMNSMNIEFSVLLKEMKDNIIFFSSLMLLIFLVNILGLVPYIFTPTSQMSLNLSLALLFWFSFMLLGWILSMNMMFCHLVPMGTPYALMFFMVMIESISNFIRFITLSVRLTANMVAGHLLLGLIGDTELKVSLLMFLLLLISQTGLFILEIFVAFIQSYVFSMLSVIYFLEVK